MNKFCKDCKWFRLSWVDRIMRLHRFGKCANPKCGTTQLSTTDDLVDGRVRSKYHYCSAMRSDLYGTCKSIGTLWEPK